MKRLLRVLLPVLGVTSCSAGSSGSPAYLVGTHDLVVVDGLEKDGRLARPGNPDAGLVGVPNRYVFITSADTNELRVLNNYRVGFTNRAFVTAPNPLENLSIPVLDRPTMLAADEGLSDDGRRVTGRFVYAARAGGTELSIIDATDDAAGLRQITRTPFALPAPVTAIVAWFGHGLSTLSDVTHVYISTWDGTVGSVFVLDLPTARERFSEIPSIKAKRLFDVPGEAIVALKVLPPLTGRTVDGQPFCASSDCLAFATRRKAGTEGQAGLVDLASSRTAQLTFPGPVRELAAAPDGVRVYGVLSEELCNATVCGGLLAIDTRKGTAGGFPVLEDFSGRPMLPIGTGATLPRGLTIGAGTETNLLTIQQTVVDGGIIGLGAFGYDQLGVFSNSNGEFAVFDPVAAVPVDFDGRAPLLTQGTLRAPLPLQDGGFGYVSEDGGVNYAQNGAFVTRTDDGANEMVRTWSVQADGGDFADRTMTVTVSDGQLLSQDILVTYQGVLPGFDTLPTTQADGTQLKFPLNEGREQRVTSGDRVLFGAQEADGGLYTCAETAVVGVDAGTLLVGAVPCDGRVTYSVRAAGAKPIVVVGAVDGFLGRGAPGETVAYSRRYLVRPISYDGVNRAGISISLDAVPQIPGAYWTLSLNGYINTYRIELDSSTLGCSTFVPGRLVMGMFPKYLNPTTTVFPWSVMTLLPSSNAIAELPLLKSFDNSIGRVTATDQASCWK